MPAASAPPSSPRTLALRPSWWWGFALYAAISTVHISALATGAAIHGPTKLLLMPALALAVWWASRGLRFGTPLALLYGAHVFSWLGDGAATFFPFFDDELPMMLLCFGLAHAAYIALFLRHLAERPFPRWAAVYGLWWLVLVIILLPHLGALTIPVMIYGLILGTTAALSARSTALVATGGALFLASDTILAFRIFLPDAMPDATSPLVMITYCAGQGLIAAGAVRALHRRAQ